MAPAKTRFSQTEDKKTGEGARGNELRVNSGSHTHAGLNSMGCRQREGATQAH